MVRSKGEVLPFTVNGQDFELVRESGHGYLTRAAVEAAKVITEREVRSGGAITAIRIDLQSEYISANCTVRKALPKEQLFHITYKKSVPETHFEVISAASRSEAHEKLRAVYGADIDIIGSYT